MDFTTPPKRPEPPRHQTRDSTVLSARRAQRPVVAAPVRPPKKNAISINIHLTKPEFKRFKHFWAATRKHITRRQVITTAVILALIIGSWTALVIRKHQLDRRASLHPSQSLANPGTTGTLDLPNFVPAVPGAKQELLTPDGIHSQYDKTKASYSFVDSIKGQQFTVSQQRIGGSTGTGQAAIDKVAKSLKATTPLKTGWGTAYILTNKKFNSQTLVFGIRDLLIFIQAPFILSNDQWTTYINDLD